MSGRRTPLELQRVPEGHYYFRTTIDQRVAHDVWHWRVRLKFLVLDDVAFELLPRPSC
tara:strand:+ start:1753 stop:1926 length:174 start_codon:yes stop_codon:yes gene_type:complete